MPECEEVVNRSLELLSEVLRKSLDGRFTGAEMELDLFYDKYIPKLETACHLPPETTKDIKNEASKLFAAIDVWDLKSIKKLSTELMKKLTEI